MKPTKKRRPIEEKPAPASYSSLPFEVRLDVYELIFSDEIHRAFRDGDHWPSGLKFSFYGLHLTNRQVYSEDAAHCPQTIPCPATKDSSDLLGLSITRRYEIKIPYLDATVDSQI